MHRISEWSSDAPSYIPMDGGHSGGAHIEVMFFGLHMKDQWASIAELCANNVFCDRAEVQALDARDRCRTRGSSQTWTLDPALDARNARTGALGTACPGGSSDSKAFDHKGEPHKLPESPVS